MRDPARIDRILTKLGEVWRKSPDMRLGQLVDNLRLREPTPFQRFNVEDDRIEAAIARVVAGGWEAL